MWKRLLAAVCLVTAVCLSQALAQDKSNRLTVSDVFNLESVSEPQISPDGKKIIYVRGFSDIMSDTRYSNLWMINFDGSDNRPLTTGNYNDSSPRWSRKRRRRSSTCPRRPPARSGPNRRRWWINWSTASTAPAT